MRAPPPMRQEWKPMTPRAWWLSIGLFLLLMLIVLVPIAFAQQSSYPYPSHPTNSQPVFITPYNIQALRVGSVTTGGTAVTPLNAGDRTRGGWIQNPAAAGAALCINETGAVASGTTTAGSLICIAAGTIFQLAPSAQSVSVVSSDSAHPFGGEGYN